MSSTHQANSSLANLCWCVGVVCVVVGACFTCGCGCWFHVWLWVLVSRVVVGAGFTCGCGCCLLCLCAFFSCFVVVRRVGRREGCGVLCTTSHQDFTLLLPDQPNAHFWWSTSVNRGNNSTRRLHRERRKERKWERERDKQERSFGLQSKEDDDIRNMVSPVVKLHPNLFRRVKENRRTVCGTLPSKHSNVVLVRTIMNGGAFINGFFAPQHRETKRNKNLRAEQRTHFW